MSTTSAERRFTKVPVELRAAGDARKIGGYAALFNRPSRNLGGFVETIDPRFFDKSRADGWPDVMARYNHEDNMLLGTTGGGTLRLKVDGTGLDYEVDMPTARADVSELVQRGDVRKSSFAFRAFEEDWSLNDQGFPLRTLLSGQLVDVAPVNTPAYADTSVGGRALGDITEALQSLSIKFSISFDETRNLAAKDELRKLFVKTDESVKPGPKPGGLPQRAIADLLAKRDPWADR